VWKDDVARTLEPLILLLRHARQALLPSRRTLFVSHLLSSSIYAYVKLTCKLLDELLVLCFNKMIANDKAHSLSATPIQPLHRS
jgi:hypothetical protein